MQLAGALGLRNVGLCPIEQSPQLMRGPLGGRTEITECPLRVSIMLALSISTAPSLLRAQSNRREREWFRADSVVSVGDRHVGLRIYAWRDFQPPRGGGGSDLRVNLQITSLDAAPLPAGLRVDSAWVRSAEGLWATAPTKESRPDLENGLDLMLRGGPKWKTGQDLDVLLRLRLPTGKARYVLARRQPLNETS